MFALDRQLQAEAVFDDPPAVLTKADSRRSAGMLAGYPQSKAHRLARDGASRIRHFVAGIMGGLTGCRQVTPIMETGNGT